MDLLADALGVGGCDEARRRGLHRGEAGRRVPRRHRRRQLRSQGSNITTPCMLIRISKVPNAFHIPFFLQFCILKAQHPYY